MTTKWGLPILTWVLLLLALGLLGVVWTTVVVIGAGEIWWWRWEAQVWQSVVTALTGLALAVFASLAVSLQAQTAVLVRQQLWVMQQMESRDHLRHIQGR